MDAFSKEIGGVSFTSQFFYLNNLGQKNLGGDEPRPRSYTYILANIARKVKG
jgi:hypothetical protein